MWPFSHFSPGPPMAVDEFHDTPLSHCRLDGTLLIGGWCSQCDLERIWATQRPWLDGPG